MKKIFFLFLCLVFSLEMDGQTIKCGDLFPIDIADRSSTDFPSMVWPYLWDIPITTFDEYFCIIEEQTGYTAPDYIDRSFTPIFVEEAEVAWFLTIGYYNSNYFLILEERNRGMCYKVDGNYYVEYSPKHNYCRSYASQDFYGVYRPTPKVMYAEYDDKNRMTLFTTDGFSVDEVIESNRMIRPENPWRVVYTADGYVEKVQNNSVTITLKWDLEKHFIYYYGVNNSRGKKHFDIHGIEYSDVDDLGRWRKAIFYDYDVIEDTLVPSKTIVRWFLPKSEFWEYHDCDFNPYEVESERRFKSGKDY